MEWSFTFILLQCQRNLNYNNRLITWSSLDLLTGVFLLSYLFKIHFYMPFAVMLHHLFLQSLSVICFIRQHYSDYTQCWGQERPRHYTGVNILSTMGRKVPRKLTLFDPVTGWWWWWWCITKPTVLTCCSWVNQSFLWRCECSCVLKALCSPFVFG